MNDLYIVADAKLSRSADILQGLRKISDKDAIILFSGIITQSNPSDLYQLLDGIEGKKYIIDYNSKDSFSKEELYKIGFNKVFSIPGFFKGRIRGKEEKIFMPTNRRDYEKWKAAGKFIVAPYSICEVEAYEDRVLNISVDRWGYEPLRMDSIVMLLERMSVFDDMENSEKNLNLEG